MGHTKMILEKLTFCWTTTSFQFFVYLEKFMAVIEGSSPKSKVHPQNLSFEEDMNVSIIHPISNDHFQRTPVDPEW